MNTEQRFVLSLNIFLIVSISLTFSRFVLEPGSIYNLLSVYRFTAN
jgi:hypothetical protein